MAIGDSDHPNINPHTRAHMGALRGKQVAGYVPCARRLSVGSQGRRGTDEVVIATSE